MTAYFKSYEVVVPIPIYVLLVGALFLVGIAALFLLIRKRR